MNSRDFFLEKRRKFIKAVFDEEMPIKQAMEKFDVRPSTSRYWIREEKKKRDQIETQEQANKREDLEQEQRARDRKREFREFQARVQSEMLALHATITELNKVFENNMHLFDV